MIVIDYGGEKQNEDTTNGSCCWKSLKTRVEVPWEIDCGAWKCWRVPLNDTINSNEILEACIQMQLKDYDRCVANRIVNNKQSDFTPTGAIWHPQQYPIETKERSSQTCPGTGRQVNLPQGRIKMYFWSHTWVDQPAQWSDMFMLLLPLLARVQAFGSTAMISLID